MAQAIDLLDDVVREELPQMFIDLEPTIAPMFSEIKRTSMGVVSSQEVGKTWKVVHFYNTGTAGSFESGDPLGPDMSTMAGNQAQLLALGTAASNLAIFPKATEVPHTGEVKRELQLHKVNGNYSIPVAWRQLDKLNAMQLKKVQRDLKAVAMAKILYEASSFHSYEVANQSGYVNQVLGRISAIQEHAAGGNYADYITITLDEQYGRIANFVKGQRIDLVDDVSGTLQNGVDTNGTDVKNYDTSGNYIMLVVIDVDYLGKKIHLRPVNTSDGSLPDYTAGYYGSTVPAAANDWICAANTTTYTGGSRPQFSWGINSWVKESGQILGGADGASGLDLDIYSMFKSKVTDVSGPLTDEVLNAEIAAYMDAYPGDSLDTIITTQGVQQEWLKQPGLYNNRNSYDRTGKALDVVGGWTKLEYMFGGRMFKMVISPMQLKKTLHVMKFNGNNISQYAPPRVGGSDADMGPELEFLQSAQGPGVFMVSHASTGQPQDLLEAPFWYYRLICPKDPRGIKLDNLVEGI